MVHGQKSVLRNFTQTCYELLGSSTSPEEVTTLYNGYLACATAGNADAFIRESRPFAERHRELIVRVHGLVSSTGRPLPGSTVESLLTKFVADKGYSVEKLREDILSIETSVPSSLTVPSASTTTTDQATETIVDTGVTKSLQSNDNACGTDYDADYLTAFESEFDRPMFVQEYFMFKSRFPSVANLRLALADLHTSFNDVYVNARQAYLNYMDKGLGMHEFVKRHLSEFERPGFLGDLVKTMLLSDEYAACMQDRLRILHKTMYDLEVREEDIGYLLKRVRNRSLSLSSETLSAEVADFHTESQSMGASVNACFKAVLRRPAEPAELSENITAFRYMMNTTGNALPECEASLQRNLISSLEFHDVIKGMLADVLESASISLRYAALNAVIQRIRPSDDIAKVASYVAEVAAQFAA